MKTHAVIDVSSLPSHGFDTRAPLWWGNLLLLLIETTMFAIVAAAYFYLMQNFTVWPPPRPTPPSLLNPLPDLGAAVANMAVLAASAGVMVWVDRSARRGDERAVKTGLVTCIALAAVSIALRAFEFGATHFWWNTNAYGSIVWTALGFHLLHVIVAALEAFLLSMWTFKKGLDSKHAMDVTVLAVYWYWVVGIWLPIFAIVYFVPRLV